MAHALALLIALLAGPNDDLATLRKEVDSLKQAVAEAASQRALAELETRIERLRAEIDRAQAGRAGEEDVRRALDSLAAQVAELERRTAGLRGGVAQLGGAGAGGLETGEPGEGAEGLGPGGAFGPGGSAPIALPPGLRDLRSGLGRSLGLATEDGAFRLRIGALFQARYQGLQVDDHQETPTTQDSSGFLVPRARLDLWGVAFLPQVGYRLLVDFARDPTLLDAWVQWTPCECVSLRAGRFETPFGRQWLTPAEGFSFVVRSDATDLFRPDRDIGLQAQTSFLRRRARLFVAVQNGTSAARNDNIDLVYAVRLSFEPFGPAPLGEGDPDHRARPLLALGGSFLYDLVPTDARLVGLPDDVDGDGEVDNVAVELAGGDAALFWRGWFVQAEIFWRRLDYGSARTPSTPSYLGLYAQASYFLRPAELEVGARYSYAEPSPLGLDVPARQALPATHHEASGVLSYLWAGRLLQAQLEYSYLVDEDVPELPGLGRSRYAHRMRLQVQLGL